MIQLTEALTRYPVAIDPSSAGRAEPVARALRVAAALADDTKGGDDGTVPIPEPLRPYLDAAIKLSPSKWIFPAADGKQRAPDTNLKAVLRRALGRAGIVDGYGHRCRKPGCGHVELTTDDANRRCPEDNRALWIRPLPEEGHRRLRVTELEWLGRRLGAKAFGHSG